MAAGLKSALQTLQNVSNPQQAFLQMLQGNPNVKAMMDVVKQYGGDPQKAFYAEAQKKGVDPEQILSMLR